MDDKPLCVGPNGERLSVEQMFWNVISEAEREWSLQEEGKQDIDWPEKWSEADCEAYLSARLVGHLHSILSLAKHMPRLPPTPDNRIDKRRQVRNPSPV